MSRGWESKSVEDQQAQQAQHAQAAEPTTQESLGAAPTAKLRSNNHADADQKRRIQALELQRERVLSERTSSPHRRSALGAALDSIEEELAHLGWTIHL